MGQFQSIREPRTKVKYVDGLSKINCLINWLTSVGVTYICMIAKIRKLIGKEDDIHHGF